MTRYAENTSVSVENSRAEIERILRRYGADSFAYGWDQARAQIEFVHEARRVRFVLPLPDRSNREFTHTEARKQRRTSEQAEAAWEQACRQRWRALALAIKAKLEAVAAEITTFEDEFLAHIVLPDNTTVGQTIAPQIADAYDRGTNVLALNA